MHSLTYRGKFFMLKVRTLDFLAAKNLFYLSKKWLTLCKRLLLIQSSLIASFSLSYILATSEVISLCKLTCDSVYS